MAEVTKQRAGEIIRAVFDVLLDKPEGMAARDVIEVVTARLNLSDYERGHYPSQPGVRRIDTIVRFSTISPVKAGWLIKSKGTWTLTDEGRTAFETFRDPLAFMNEAYRYYREWKHAQPVDDDDMGDNVEVEGVAEGASTIASLEKAEEDAWAEIDAYLRSMPPYLFQELVGALLRAMGYHVPWVAPQGKDGGVDLIAYTDPLGAKGPRIKVQVKRYTTSKVAVGDLRSFLAVLGTQDIGLFVAVSGFTADAEAEARAQENRRLTLIDLERLFELWVEHYDNLTEEDKRRLPLRPVYYLAPND